MVVCCPSLLVVVMYDVDVMVSRVCELDGVLEGGVVVDPVVLEDCGPLDEEDELDRVGVGVGVGVGVFDGGVGVGVGVAGGVVEDDDDDVESLGVPVPV